MSLCVFNRGSGLILSCKMCWGTGSGCLGLGLLLPPRAMISKRVCAQPDKTN